jgi:hypothetical protein
MLASPVVLWRGGRALSRVAAICILAVLAWTGCRRNTGPDASYQQAFTLYQQLYASQLDDAYGDPRMEEVVALLRAVDSRSSDAATADGLLGTIQRGRDALAKERAAREKLTGAANAPVATSDIDPSKFFPTSAPPDAGVQDPFGPGASVAELNAQSGGCLADNEPFTEQGTGVTGTVYRVVPTEGCKGKLPGLTGQIVLVVGGKIYRRTADPRPPPAAAPDAGVQTAARTATAPARSSKPAEAPPPYQVVYPGQPIPEGMVPATAQQQQQ